MLSVLHFFLVFPVEFILIELKTMTEFLIPPLHLCLKFSFIFFISLSLYAVFLVIFSDEISSSLILLGAFKTHSLTFSFLQLCFSFLKNEMKLLIICLFLFYHVLFFYYDFYFTFYFPNIFCKMIL